VIEFQQKMAVIHRSIFEILRHKMQHVRCVVIVDTSTRTISRRSVSVVVVDVMSLSPVVCDVSSVVNQWWKSKSFTVKSSRHRLAGHCAHNQCQKKYYLHTTC